MIGAMFRQKSVIEVIETRIGKPSDLRSQIDIRRIDRLVEIACYRFHALMRTKPIQDIYSGKIKRWYIFSRLEKTKLKKYQPIAHISRLSLVQIDAKGIGSPCWKDSQPNGCHVRSET